jgi:hypothetical protein
MVDTRERSCQSENVANNFVLYRPQDQQLSSRMPFANSRDASFLLACANNRPGYRKGSDLVAVVHGRLPVTPVGLADAPFVGDPMVGPGWMVGGRAALGVGARLTPPLPTNKLEPQTTTSPPPPPSLTPTTCATPLSRWRTSTRRAPSCAQLETTSSAPSTTSATAP